MTKYFCDRCGKEAHTTDMYVRFPAFITSFGAELCRDCCSLMREMLREFKENK